MILGLILMTLIQEVLGPTITRDQSTFYMQVWDQSGQIMTGEDAHLPDKIIYPASTLKTLIALATLKEIDEGRLSFDQVVTIDQPNAAGECLDWDCSLYGPGAKRTVAELLEDSMTVSNNLASNQLMDIAGGRDSINRLADAAGWTELRVRRKMYSRINPEPQLTVSNSATVRGLVKLYKEIAFGSQKILKAESQIYLKNLLGRVQTNDRLNARWPAEMKFHHKPGNTSRVTGDAGFFELGGKVHIVAGLVEFSQTTLPSGESISGFEALARIGERLLATLSAPQ
jgi:beta-lactamase class A